MAWSSVTQQIQEYWQRWLGKKLPASPVVELHRRNIFILPSTFGACYLLLCLVIFILGTNYQNNLVLLLSMLLFSIFMSCMLRCYQNLAALKISRLGLGERFAGEPLSYKLQLSSDKSHYQIELQFKDAQPNVVEWVHAQVSTAVYCDPQSRGWFAPGRVNIASCYPLGLFRAWSELDLSLGGLIYPAPVEGQQALQSLSQSPEGTESQYSPAEGDELTGLRSYRAGESLSRVAWKQFAQGRGMMSKEFEAGQGSPQWLILPEVDERGLEFQLSLLCGQILLLSRQQRLFGLKLGTQELSPDSGAKHRRQALSMLAEYQGGSHARPAPEVRAP